MLYTEDFSMRHYIMSGFLKSGHNYHIAIASGRGV